tara:strand:- start:10590 stop:10925 length:336 start_codon:yes stop_codon:yes gene_type:complete
MDLLINLSDTAEYEVTLDTLELIQMGIKQTKISYATLTCQEYLEKCNEAISISNQLLILAPSVIKTTDLNTRVSAYLSLTLWTLRKHVIYYYLEMSGENWNEKTTLLNQLF